MAQLPTTARGGTSGLHARTYQNPAYPGVATWHTDRTRRGSPETGVIDLVSNPKGMAFEQWLQIVGVSASGSGTVALDPVFHNSDTIVAPTQQWLYWGSSDADPLHVQHPRRRRGVRDQCGRVVYSDWHADNLGFPDTFPECWILLVPHDGALSTATA